MLKSLHISNYALIEKLDIGFSSGFSVITGETGAGKSIILGAMGLLLGQRSDTKTIKPGAGKCCVEAVFDIRGLGLEAFFAENDIDFEDSECIVRREVTATGKSRAFINDTPVAIAKLKEFSSHIIDIHSQHQNLLVGHECFLLNLLDTVADNAAEAELFRQSYMAWRKAGKELRKLQEQAEKDRAEQDYLRFQLQQLEESNLQEGEQEELEQEAQTLSHAEDIKGALYQVASHICSEESNLSGKLRQCEQTLRNISEVFPGAASLSERLESVRIELEDIGQEVESGLEQVEFNPERLAFVESRLDVIYGLEKKHHAESVAALLQILAELRERLDSIENIDQLILEQEKALSALSDRVESLGEKLTGSRRRAAAQVIQEITETLQGLGMPDVVLDFDFSRRPHPEENGVDNVALLFSSNKNIPAQDVSSVASGGEIARLMLSLKTLLSRHQNLPTVIFDEIDTGVSGTMAEKMAMVMQRMAENCQVLCITHLPQIAARGANHYRVYKSKHDACTTTHMVCLSEKERITEIANMLSGEELTEAAINNAKSLLRL